MMKNLVKVMAALTILLGVGVMDGNAVTPGKGNARKTAVKKSSGSSNSASKYNMVNMEFAGEIASQGNYWMEVKFISATECEGKWSDYDEEISNTESFKGTYSITGKYLKITSRSFPQVDGMKFEILNYGTGNCQLEWYYRGPQPFQGTLEEKH